MQPITRSRARGWSLTEIMLVLAALLGVGVLSYQAHERSALAAEVQLEQNNLKALSASIAGSYGAVGDFSAVSAEALASAALAPVAMRSGAGLVHTWSSTVAVAPTTFAAANDGFAITYNDLPAAACSRLVTAAGAAASDVTVDGVSVMTSRKIVAATLAGRCAEASNDVVFRYRASDGAQQAAAVIAAPAPDPSIPPTPPCATCPGATVAPGVTPVAPPAGPTPAPPPIAIPGGVLNPGPAAPPCDMPTVESRAVACPAGQVGNKIERRTSVCGSGVWSGWGMFYDGCNPTSPKPIVVPPAPAGCPMCMDGVSYVQNQNYNPSYPATWSCGAAPPAWSSGLCAPPTPPPAACSYKVSLTAGAGRCTSTSCNIGKVNFGSSTDAPRNLNIVTSYGAGAGAGHATVGGTIQYNGATFTIPTQSCGVQNGTPSCSILSSYTVGGGTFELEVFASYAPGSGDATVDATLSLLTEAASCASSTCGFTANRFGGSGHACSNGDLGSRDRFRRCMSSADGSTYCGDAVDQGWICPDGVNPFGDPGCEAPQTYFSSSAHPRNGGGEWTWDSSSSTWNYSEGEGNFQPTGGLSNSYTCAQIAAEPKVEPGAATGLAAAPPRNMWIRNTTTSVGANACAAPYSYQPPAMAACFSGNNGATTSRLEPANPVACAPAYTTYSSTSYQSNYTCTNTAFVCAAAPPPPPPPPPPGTCNYECDSPGETGNTCANGRVKATSCATDGAYHPNGNFGGNRTASAGGFPAVPGQTACPAMATCDPIGAVCVCTPPPPPSCAAGRTPVWKCMSFGEVGNSCRLGPIANVDKACASLGTTHPDANFGGRYNYGGAAWPGQLACPGSSVCDPIAARCACSGICPGPETETVNMTGDACGMGDPSVWGGSVNGTFSRTRTATCDDELGTVTWSAWSDWAYVGAPLGGCLCEVRPSNMGGPAAPLSPTGWRLPGEPFDTVCT